MILNIRDRRKNPLRWQHVTAICEATWHDNSRADSDKAKRDDKNVGYDEWPDVSVVRAIEIADALPYEATLYLYDLGDGIREATAEEIAARSRTEGAAS